MNRQTLRTTIAGAAGAIELALDRPPASPRGLALVAHPHPLHGGTLDNKVAQTLARAWVQLGFVVLRPNFRGVGASAGQFDGGRGETDDLQQVLEHHLQTLRAELGDAPQLALAGFSFGAFVAAALAARLRDAGRAPRHLTLVGPAVVNFALPALREPQPLAERMLVVHGEADEVVPLAAVLDWARPQQQPVLVAPGSGHFFHGMLTPLKDWVCAWHGGAV